MRGKKAAAAAKRRDAADTEATIASYQTTIKRLTSEVTDLKVKLSGAEESKRREIGRLSSELHEAVSPELRAAKQMIEDLKDKLGRAGSRATDLQKRYDIVFMMAKRLLMELGMTNLEATEAILSEFAGRKIRVSLDIPNSLHRTDDVEAIEAIQRARGLRH